MYNKVEKLNEKLGNIDIYLLDQIMKGRYAQNDRILDVGCGGGRNLIWFHQNEYDIYGLDANLAVVQNIRQEFKKDVIHFRHETLEENTFEKRSFDHIICNAVLHFAQDKEHFYLMFEKLIDLLKTGGSIFVRMTSNIGIENFISPIDNDLFLLPDGSERFLLTREIISNLMVLHNLHFLEQMKSVNVNDQRTMTTLVMAKG